MLLIVATMFVARAPAQSGEGDRSPAITIHVAALSERENYEVVPASGTGRSRAQKTPLGGGELVEKNVGAGLAVLQWRVPVETYLIGVVGAEMGPDAPDAALEAQAIASRTFAMYALRSPRRADVGAMVDLTHRTQAYDWARGEASDAVRRAVENTRGMIVVGDNDRHALFTPFHACCGGHTSLASVAWSGSDDPLHLTAAWRTERPSSTITRLGADSLAGETAARAWHRDRADDGWCAPGHDGIPTWAASSFRWRRELTAEQAKRALVGGWRVARRGPGGHIAELRVGERSVGGDLAIRGLVSPPLPSSNFSWVPRADGSIILFGAGSGHGVGMCQLCARGMAAQGFEAAEILAEFYGEPAHLLAR
jgi:stage II sporulation protein D